MVFELVNIHTFLDIYYIIPYMCIYIKRGVRPDGPLARNNNNKKFLIFLGFRLFNELLFLVFINYYFRIFKNNKRILGARSSTLAPVNHLTIDGTDWIWS